MKKRNLVVANWKMHPETLEEAKKIFNSSRLAAKTLKNTDVVICPPFPFLQPLSKLEHPKNLYFGAQNICSEPEGAFTGEVSAVIIKNLEAKYAIIGHSERRAIGETNQIVARKLQTAYDGGLIPILCVGEKSRDRDGSHLEFLRNQIKECINSLQRKHLVGMIIAYEPVWAIGKSYKEALGATDVHEMTLFIKKSAGEIVGMDLAESFKILYGGSVETANDDDIMEKGNVLGFLVGHASLDTKAFPSILKVADTKK